MTETKKTKNPADIFQSSSEKGLDYITLISPGIPAFRLVHIPGRTFTMGKAKVEHEVLLSSFYMAEFPVTQELFSSVTGENPSRFKGKRRPVERVSWYDAIEFCNKLSFKVGLKEYYFMDKSRKDPNNLRTYDNLKWFVEINKGSAGFRLPTEAQWEYAAKGGHKAKPFSYAGSNILENVGWYGENSHRETKPVGLKLPNQLGLYDLSGNVWEWCWDWYDKYKTGDQIDPEGPENGSSRVFRGGSWIGDAEWCTPLYRNGWGPDSRNDFIGFRVVFVP